MQSATHRRAGKPAAGWEGRPGEKKGVSTLDKLVHSAQTAGRGTPTGGGSPYRDAGRPAGGVRGRCRRFAPCLPRRSTQPPFPPLRSFVFSVGGKFHSR